MRVHPVIFAAAITTAGAYSTGCSGANGTPSGVVETASSHDVSETGDDGVDARAPGSHRVDDVLPESDSAAGPLDASADANGSGPASGPAGCGPALLLDRRVIHSWQGGLTATRFSQATAPFTGTVSTSDSAFRTVGLAGYQGSQARVAMAANGPGGCVISRWSADLAPLAETLFADERCLSLVETPEGVLVAAQGDGDARLVLLAHDTLAVRAVAALPSEPTARPVAADLDATGRVSTGGSHWLVGLSGGALVASVTSSDIAVGPLLALPGVVRDLSTVLDGRSVAVVGTSTDDEGVLGRTLVRIVNTDGVLTALPPIESPDPITAPLALRLPCEEPLLGPAQCDEGLIVAAGREYVRTYSLATGESVTSVPVPAFLATALAIGDDDWVYTGGSHWLGERGGVYRVHLGDGALESLAAFAIGSARTVPSLVPLGDGEMAVLACTETGPTLYTAPGPAQVAPGWPVVGGELSRPGAPTLDPTACPGARRHVWTTVPDLNVRLHGVVALPDGGVAAAGASLDQPNGDLVVLRLGPAGQFTWLSPHVAPGQGSGSSLAVLPGGRLVVAGHEGVAASAGGVVHIVALDGTYEQSQVLAVDGEDELSDVDVLSDGGIGTVGWRTADGPSHQVRVVRLTPALTVDWDIVLGAGGLGTGRGLAPMDGGGLVVVGAERDGTNGQDDGFVARLDATGEEAWSTRLGGPFDDVFEDVAAVPGGTLAAVGARSLSGEERATWLVLIDADGQVLLDRILAGSEASAVVAWDDHLDLFGDDFVGSRVDLFGNVITAGELDTGLEVMEKRSIKALSPGPDGGLVVGGVLFDAPGVVRPVLALTDAWGRASCEAAGVCVHADSTACDDADPCTSDRCDPYTGSCAHSPLSEGAPCAVGSTCQVGVCKP